MKDEDPPFDKSNLDSGSRSLPASCFMARRFKELGRLLANVDGFRPLGSPVPGRFAPVFENIQGKVR